MNPQPTRWMGAVRFILHVLRTLRRGRRAGPFYVLGNVVAFLGMPGENLDQVVGPDAEYRSGGQWRNLGSAMNATSYGLRNVAVI